MRLAILALLFVSSTAAADGLRHDGFYFHGETSLEWVGVNDGAGDYASGSVLGLGFALGGSLAPRLILAGDAWLGLVLSTTACTPFGCSVYPGGVYGGIAPKLVGYLGDSGVFLSGAVGPNFGAGVVVPTFRFSVGKEWQVGSHWGLGVEALAMFRLPFDAYVQRNVLATNLGVAFSFTRN